MKVGKYMHTLPIGKVQTMTVSRKIDTGYVLEKDGQEALLHHNEANHTYDEGREIDVFLYNDKKGNIAATA
ncbi:S1 RNA-binding domain-containing protein, partial [Staphylococcus sp. SIMBA_130]